jgi:hypothetical protein
MTCRRYRDCSQKSNRRIEKIKMAYFLKSGDKFTVKTKEALDLHDLLPLGTYTVGFNECSGQFYLEKIEPFQIEGKLYGDTNSTAARILSTFHDRPKSTGVLLAGEKGSGKTMVRIFNVHLYFSDCCVGSSIPHSRMTIACRHLSWLNAFQSLQQKLIPQLS